MIKISDVDIYMFGRGTHYEIYNKLGAHIAEKDGVKGTFFAVWAPFAKKVSVAVDSLSSINEEIKKEPLKQEPQAKNKSRFL